MPAEDYIGKKLSETPDGTVAVVQDGDGDYQIAMLSFGTACYANIDKDCRDGNPKPGYEHRDVCLKDKVVSIIKLGEERPRTLDKCKPLEAWRDERGDVHFDDGRGNHYFLAFPEWVFPVRQYGPSSSRIIGPDWTCLGLITGIEINGKVWRGEARDGE